MESRIGALCIGVFLSWNAAPADAQGLHLIPGVAEIATDTIDDIAIATVDLPQPAIYYNPIRARRYGPQLTEFFLAHEYGHIALHHTRTGLSVLPDEARDSVLQLQELEADCYAARRGDSRARATSEAAIRFFTRLGPFRFDAVHPTGSQRAARIMDCMPPLPPDEREQKVGIGETGVEVGPVSGDVERITFNVNVAALAQTERGREAQLWVDGLDVGRISNMRIPWSLSINRFGAGIHSYRMELALYDEEGFLQFSRSGTVVGHGHIFVREGDSFLVDWSPGSPPSLIKTSGP
ncbi:MAG TPA: hypothetical protein VLB12_09815 [Gemmatimonadales bacterium]|nr:hypothetical protein [Gemmatimonadales bacterium]